jgi:hypothetical protein
MATPDVGKQIVKVAVRQIGYGEVGANNEGKFIKAIGGTQGEEWCAAFAGWCGEQAHKELELKLPCARSLGAKKMGKNIAGAGSKFMDPLLAKPGDFIVWHRGTLGWQGHIGVVEKVVDGLVHTIEGNVGKYPAKVKRLIHDVSKEKLAFFATLRKLT